jgi:basic membrane protein A and related proteins
VTSRPLRLLALALAAALAGACGGGGSVGADAASRPGAKVGFIFVGERDDLGYNQAAWEGADAVAKAFPDNEVLRAEDVPETDEAADVLEGMIDQGAGILFATSFGHLDAAVAVARRHPEVVVLHQGGREPEEELPNLGTYWGTVWQPVYQAGIAAGRASASGRLGFVAAFPIPPTIANINAFTLGARSVNPQATTQLRWTGSWCDPAEQRRLAQQLADDGVDVLTQHQDCTRAVLGVAEDRRLFAVGYHYDGSEAAPDSWLVGAVWDWRLFYVDAVRTALSGGFRTSRYSSDYRGSYAGNDNPFVLTELSSKVPAGTAELVEASRPLLASGELPFRGPLRDNAGRERVAAGASLSTAEIESMDYLVEGVDGRLP